MPPILDRCASQRRPTSFYTSDPRPAQTCKKSARHPSDANNGQTCQQIPQLARLSRAALLPLISAIATRLRLPLRGWCVLRRGPLLCDGLRRSRSLLSFVLSGGLCRGRGPLLCGGLCSGGPLLSLVLSGG